MCCLLMFNFSSIALAVFGVVPMIWSYIEALSYGFNAQITNHWGVNFVLIGFFMYVLSRLLMIFTKRNYKREL